MKSFYNAGLQLQLGMPISRLFSFLGDSGNDNFPFFGESRSYSPGSSGKFRECFFSLIKQYLKVLGLNSIKSR